MGAARATAAQRPGRPPRRRQSPGAAAQRAPPWSPSASSPAAGTTPLTGASGRVTRRVRTGGEGARHDASGAGVWERRVSRRVFTPPRVSSATRAGTCPGVSGGGRHRLDSPASLLCLPRVLQPAVCVRRPCGHPVGTQWAPSGHPTVRLPQQIISGNLREAVAETSSVRLPSPSMSSEPACALACGGSWKVVGRC